MSDEATDNVLYGLGTSIGVLREHLEATDQERAKQHARAEFWKDKAEQRNQKLADVEAVTERLEFDLTKLKAAYQRDHDAGQRILRKYDRITLDLAVYIEELKKSRKKAKTAGERGRLDELIDQLWAIYRPEGAA